MLMFCWERFQGYTMCLTNRRYANRGSSKAVKPKTHFKVLQPQRLLVHREYLIKNT